VVDDGSSDVLRPWIVNGNLGARNRPYLGIRSRCGDTDFSGLAYERAEYIAP
jgi:hypothetical protein